MATGSRTLTLKLLADITNFNDNISKGNKSVESFSSQVADFSKKAAVAFTAAAVAVGAYVKAVVENAAADEAAQRKLAQTIENTTNATQAQISAVETWISTTSISIGVTDDELRPALARLVRSTNDVEQAQKLLNLALDISTATGKPLEAVSNALGKAYDGNATSLGRLGLGLDASTLKSKDFNAIFETLDKTFGNFAENEAVSTEKQLARVKIALDEANESIGAALLPVVQNLTAWLLEHFVPALQATIGGLTGDKSLKDSLNGTYEQFYNWGVRIREIINVIISLKDEILIVAGVMATMFVASKIAAGVAATISTINLLIKAYNALKASSFVAGVAAYFALNPLAGIAATAAGIAIIAGATKYINGLDGGEVSTSGIYTGNPNLKTSGGGTTIPKVSTTPIPSIAGGATGVSSAVNNAAGATMDLYGNTLNPISGARISGAVTDPNVIANYNSLFNGKTPITVNVSGAIDPEGTARTIVNTLNNSYYRGTGGAEGLVYAQ